MSTGYSGTPLAKKLGIKAEHRVGTFSAPPHFPDILEGLPPDVTLEVFSLDGPGRDQPSPDPRLDVAVLFVTDEGDLRTRFGGVAALLRSNGGLWVAWPKKSSPLATELRDSHVRSIGLEAGLVDNKVCAIDQHWSDIRFVYRLEDR